MGLKNNLALKLCLADLTREIDANTMNYYLSYRQ